MVALVGCANKSCGIPIPTVNDRLFILHLNTLMRSILYHLMVNALPYLANHTLSLRYNVIKTDYD